MNLRDKDSSGFEFQHRKLEEEHCEVSFCLENEMEEEEERDR
jgi:hypothetical protein